MPRLHCHTILVVLPFTFRIRQYLRYAATPLRHIITTTLRYCHMTLPLITPPPLSLLPYCQDDDDIAAAIAAAIAY